MFLFSFSLFKDQLTTTSSNYESQLSTMSDHLCELSDKLLKQEEEMEVLRRGKVRVCVCVCVCV